MRKIRFLILAAVFFNLLVVGQARASARAIFTADKVLVFVQGKMLDVDPYQLYAAMQVKGELENGVVTKKSIYTSQGKEKVFDIICTIAASASDQGLCTMAFYPSSYSQIDVNKKSAQILLRGTEAQALAALFRAPDVQGKVYQTADKHFGIFYSAGSSGAEAQTKIYFR